MSSKAAQGKKQQTDLGNGTSKRDISMGYSKKDSADAKSGKADGKIQNGTKSGFRTDAAISNSRTGQERTLQRWVPDIAEGADGSLEKSSNTGHWDQFAENERLFGLKTDYDENIYTTKIDKSHPQYRERMAAAERKAREIEGSAATTAHVAEERVMDFAGGDDKGGDEEDKYSGVRRQDFPPLASRENKYTPPAKRAPSAQATVAGAPVDPAIISSQLKGPPTKTLAPTKAEESKPQAPIRANSPATPNLEAPRILDSKPETSNAVEAKASEAKPADKIATPLRPAAASGRTASPKVNEGAPSATSTVERDVLNSFKNFATRERSNAEKVRSVKAKADKEVKLTELKKFADTFKLATPVPSDLIGIIAKDPVKQKEIQAKAQRNAEDIAKQKAEAATKEKEPTPKEAPPKAAVETTSAPAPPETKATSRPAAVPHATSPSGVPGRHPGGRQSYGPQQYHNQSYRNDRSGPQHIPPQNRQTGNLAQRLRNVEQQKMAQQPNHVHVGGPDMRLPPTGPANNVDPGFNRRLSHMGPKLNPSSHEFRPNAFAAPFNPNAHPSAGSSPRSAVNNVVEAPSAPAPTPQLIRRKTKAVDPKKCCILIHIKAFQPTPGRKFDDNEGLRPSYDTLPTWRQLQEENEKPDSTMHLTYAQYFERHPFAGSSSMATPNPSHVVPQIYQGQLPYHIQHGGHNLAPGRSPHMPPMQMHTGQHGHVSHVPFNNGDDHRMMHSNSAQSYASPRMAQVPMAYPPAMNSPAQVPYSQPVMQPFVGAGAPQMGQFRSFSNNPQYMAQQPGHMAAPMMVQPQFIAGPQGMVAAPQMQMYPAGAHPQFLPHGGPPQQIPGANGYSSPGRPTAPMMVHQGSQQGQPVYGMSPGVQYQQPFVPPQQGGQMGNVRGYGNHGPQHFGTSPQQMHQYGPQHRGGSGSYGKNVNFGNHGQHQGPPSIPAGPHGRGPEGPEEAK